MQYNNNGKLSQKYEKWIKAGRGTGTLKDYIPWLNQRSFSSSGILHRPKGIKTHRRHVLFSNNEDTAFKIFDLSLGIFDIREQFPLLPLADTKVLSDLLGIKHPTEPKTQEMVVLTTDFLLTLKDGRLELHPIF